MNTFYLIRHGEKIGEAGGPGLTKKGKTQAERTANYLKDKNIYKLFSSPYTRTQETAKIIDGSLKVGIEFDERLKERMNWGSVQGQTLEKFLEEWEYSDFHRNYKPKAGISSFEAGKNAQDVINEISKKFPDENIVLITHGGVIIDLLRNLFSDKELEKYRLDFPEEKGKECSITILVKDKGNFLLKEVGATNHLRGI